MHMEICTINKIIIIIIIIIIKHEHQKIRKSFDGQLSSVYSANVYRSLVLSVLLKLINNSLRKYKGN